MNGNTAAHLEPVDVVLSVRLICYAVVIEITQDTTQAEVSIVDKRKNQNMLAVNHSISISVSFPFSFRLLRSNKIRDLCCSNTDHIPTGSMRQKTPR